MIEQLHDPLYLSPEQLEVWGAFPYNQKAEISRRTMDFYTGFTGHHIDSYYWQCLEEYQKESMVTTIKSSIVDMVWQDFDLADQAGFPEPTPQSALLLARTAIVVGNILTSGQESNCDRGELAYCGTALTGLHYAILGSNDVIMSDDATANLYSTALKLHGAIFCDFE